MALSEKQIYDLNNMNVAAQNASLGNILESAGDKIGGYVQEMTIGGTMTYQSSGLYIKDFVGVMFVQNEDYVVTIDGTVHTENSVTISSDGTSASLMIDYSEYNHIPVSNGTLYLSRLAIGKLTGNLAESKLNGKKISISGKFLVLVPSEDIDLSIIGKRIFDEPSVYMADKVLTVTSMGEAKWADLPIPKATSSYNGMLLGVKLGTYNFVDNPVPTVTASNADKILRVNTSGEWVADDLVIKSSTAGSTKRFKITVDDSGTLTATEYTGA